MKVKLYLCIFICSFICNANGQEEKFTLTGKVNYKNSKIPIRIRLSCTDSRSIVAYTDSLGNYTLTRGINKDLNYGINNGVLNCAVLFELSDYKQCGHCPFIYRELSVESEKSRRLSIRLDSIISPMILNATLTEEMPDSNLPRSISFNKNSVLFTNYFSSDTLLDCVADYLLNCSECFIQIAGYADDEEANRQQLSEQRAEKVYNSLLKRGISINSLEYKGYSDANTVNGIDVLSKSSEKKCVDKCRVDFIIKNKTETK